jgi:hypothetical protein
MRLLPIGVSAAVLSAIAVGCFGSSDSPSPAPVTGNPLDGSVTNTVDSSVPPDSSTAAIDAPAGIDSAVDATGEGGAAAALSTCDTPTTIDSAHVGHSFAGAVGFGSSKYVAFWSEAQPTALFKWRFFDGTTLQPEQTIDSMDQTAILRADGLGNAYAVWRTAMAVLSPATGTFGTPTPLGRQAGAIEDVAVATMKAGGAFVFYSGNDADAGAAQSVLSTRYDPASGMWSAPEAREAGVFHTPHVAINAGGKAVAGWLNPMGNGNGTTTFSIATFDGTSWTAPVHSTLGTGTSGAGPDGFAIAAYSNGDALVIYAEQINGASRAVEAQRFHVASGQWDPPETIETASPGGETLLAIDASDRVTAVYQTNVTANHTVARRNLGTGWTPAIDLGLATSLVFALDPADNPVVVVSPPAGSLAVRRCAADGTTWDGPVPTGFASSAPNGMNMMTLAFDAAGHPVIVDADVVQAQPQQLIRLTVCQ